MKLWKSKKSAATSCVTAVKNLSGNNSKNYKDDDDKSETISAASTATPTNQIQIVNGLHQGNYFLFKENDLIEGNYSLSQP